MMISSVEVFPARSPMPLIAPSIWRAPRVDGGQGVGHRQAQVVVTVGGDDHVVPSAQHLVVHPPQQLDVVRGGGEADRVRDVDGRGAFPDGSLTAGDHEVRVRAGGVLWRELHVLRVAAGPPDRLDDRAHHFLGGHPEHPLHVDRGGALEDVDTMTVGVADRVVGPVDVIGQAAGQRSDHRPSHVLCDLGDTVEVAVGGRREAGFYDIDPQLGQLPGYGQLLVGGQGDSGRLLAVAQGGIEDYEFVLWHGGGSGCGGGCVLCR